MPHESEAAGGSGWPAVRLLERRPDIAAAERQMARRMLRSAWPRPRSFHDDLHGSFGFEGLSLATWFTWPSRVWAVGPSLAQAIFDGGLRRATVQQYRAVYEGTVATYRQTVLTTFSGDRRQSRLTTHPPHGDRRAERGGAVGAAQSAGG